MTVPDHNLIEAEVKTLIEEMRGTWPASDLPYELYHYTSAKGLLGILTSKTFWATDINFLNDATELQYASDLNNLILDAKIAATADDTVKGFLQESKLFLRLQSSTMDAYIICFCEDGNLLSQWRAYGASGSGYSLGVIAKSLVGHERRGVGTAVLETRLRKIVYTKTVQEVLVTETVDHFCDLLLRTLDETDKDHHRSIINDFANYLAGELSEYLYFFKSAVFEEEQEWRVT